ncbi:MAG: hypothetical protein MI923_25585 [Phycisphaerales bacterium]|nr:hypothetical protein [Phycisphaerales bacterium]
MPELKPSQTVRIVQTVQTREGEWQTSVEGKIISVASKPTGSWFAHGKNDRLWLKRLRLQKEDGEFVDLILDHDSVVTILE